MPRAGQQERRAPENLQITVFNVFVYLFTFNSRCSVLFRGVAVWLFIEIDLQQKVDKIEIQIIIDVRRRQTRNKRVSKAVDKALEGKPEESHGCRLNENDSKS